MVPNIIHFCFGLKEDFGQKPFSFIHYLAVKSAYECNRPEIINFFYKYKPEGLWWEKSRGYLNLIEYDPPKEVFGNPLLHYAHRADVLKLEILLKNGGIFLDLDVVCLRPFAKLMKYDLVLGKQGRRGLCNAVLLARPGSEFLKKWHETYISFRSKGRDEFWDEHSVLVPMALSRRYPGLVHVEGASSFFWPEGSTIGPLWGKDTVGIFNKLGRKFKEIISRAILSRAYCIHLWESLWWDKYLKGLTPQYIQKGNNNFSRLCRRFL
ncbi:MAG: glycosyltransferase [Candidatus Omnitrophota bacterium]